MPQNYQIRPIDLDGASLPLLKSCAELYCKIWREPPWNENFWNAADVLASIQKELSRNYSRGFLSIDSNNEVIGFTWGYQVDKDEMRAISGHARLDPFFQNETLVFYIDELGVDPGCRLKGMGKSLSKALLAWATDSGHNIALLRTDVKADPARTLYAKLGFKELDILDSNEHQRSYWYLRIN